MLLSSIVTFELTRRVEEPAEGQQHTTARNLLCRSSGIDADEDDARAAGAVRAELEAVGKPIGAYDVLLAGQARRRGATLVSSNTKEFTRVTGLKWEDWASSRR